MNTDLFNWGRYLDAVRGGVMRRNPGAEMVREARNLHLRSIVKRDAFITYLCIYYFHNNSSIFEHIHITI